MRTGRGAVLTVVAVVVLGAGAYGARAYVHHRHQQQAHATQATVAAATLRATTLDSVPGGGGLLLDPQQPNGTLAIYLHGAGGDAREVEEDPGRARLVSALLRAGYTVASADAGGDAWGNRASVADYEALYRTVKDIRPVRRVVLVGQSMGGVAGLQLVDRLPVTAFVGIFPVCNLSSIHQGGGQNAATLALAYGPSLPAAIGAGSPVPAPRRHIRAMFFASAGDTVVPKTANTDLCATELRAAGDAVTVTATSGNHGDPSNYQPQAVIPALTRG